MSVWAQQQDDGETGKAVAAGRRNMMLLIQLRWIAVAGQMVTIAVVHHGLDIRLPIPSLLIVPVLLVAMNMVTLPLVRRGKSISNRELFAALLIDVLALTWQLHQSGGPTNPFAWLFLLQVVLGAMLLRPWSSWAIVGAASLCLGLLWLDYRPLALPAAMQGNMLWIYLAGSLVCFALIAVLLVLFITRISRNLRASDAKLADIRQQAAEENHIVRMGMLASGAAHELGTPLASLSVILGDWQRIPAISRDKELVRDVSDMQAELARCKTILSNILMTAGEARGVAPTVTTVRQFLDEIVQDWRNARRPETLEYEDRFGEDVPVVSDPALKQVIGNVIDNAADASPLWVCIRASREDDTLVLDVIDRGHGFAKDMLSGFGQPYRSTKGRPGGGVGLFLLVNVLRKLGGRAVAQNRLEGGAAVRIILPLSALAYPGNS